jgi:hypothetical protein
VGGVEARELVENLIALQFENQSHFFCREVHGISDGGKRHHELPRSTCRIGVREGGVHVPIDRDEVAVYTNYLEQQRMSEAATGPQTIVGALFLGFPKTAPLHDVGAGGADEAADNGIHQGRPVACGGQDGAP